MCPVASKHSVNYKIMNLILPPTGLVLLFSRTTVIASLLKSLLLLSRLPDICFLYGDHLALYSLTFTDFLTFLTWHTELPGSLIFVFSSK